MSNVIPSRIYYEPQLKRYADEHIEAPYTAIRYRIMSPEDREAIPVLIDPYCKMLLGKRYRISIATPLCSRLQAAAWAGQFGKLHITTDDGEIVAHIHGHCAVRGKTLEDACLLAGIQVLREHSIQCLTAGGSSVN